MLNITSPFASRTFVPGPARPSVRFGSGGIAPLRIARSLCGAAPLLSDEQVAALIRRYGYASTHKAAFDKLPERIDDSIELGDVCHLHPECPGSDVAVAILLEPCEAAFKSYRHPNPAKQYNVLHAPLLERGFVLNAAGQIISEYVIEPRVDLNVTPADEEAFRELAREHGFDIDPWHRKLKNNIGFYTDPATGERSLRAIDRDLLVPQRGPRQGNFLA